ncbi:hypothetical protein ND991_19325 [Gordonia sputi]|uniref:hypothetical protein n=1 Tax=Gordonia sputi TaxID=36823 RepID=UPI002043121B|nr:hypothetical protein [Gordonia sputi]MCM3897361.1 hypothetical protein [Gordonia sputi]
MTTITHQPSVIRTAHADTVVLIMDGSVRAHSLARQILDRGKNLAIAGTRGHDLVPYVDAAVRDRVVTFIADPADPTQIDAVIERASDTLGPVIMVVDPGGLLADVRAADRHAA